MDFAAQHMRGAFALSDMEVIGHMPALLLSPSAVSGKAALVMTRSNETATPDTAVPVTTACDVAESEYVQSGVAACQARFMLLDATYVSIRGQHAGALRQLAASS